MSVIPITCDNCGAKYKLPPTFKGDQAKCQKCGSVIDVKSQREAAGDDAPAAAAKPAAAARPAKARPAVDRSKGRAAAGGSSRRGGKAAATDGADKPARAGRSRRGAAADDDGESPRRGREKKKDNTPMILGGVGLVAILVVVVVFMMNGGDDKKGDEQAQTNTQNGENAPAGDGKKDGDGAPAANDGGAKQPAEGGKPEEAAGNAGDDPKPAEGDSKPAGGGTNEPAVGEPPAPPPIEVPDGVEKRPWMKMKNPPASLSQVRPASERYGEVSWPESIDSATKQEVMEVVGDIEVDGGLPTIRAKRKLAEMEYPALFGVVEKLRTLDYTKAGDASLGYELNRLLEEIIVDMNARFESVQATEEIHPAKAEWNTQTVKAWMDVLARWPDEATFKEKRAERIRKKNG